MANANQEEKERALLLVRRRRVQLEIAVVFDEVSPEQEQFLFQEEGRKQLFQPPTGASTTLANASIAASAAVRSTFLTMIVDIGIPFSIVSESVLRISPNPHRGLLQMDLVQVICFLRLLSPLARDAHQASDADFF